MDANGNLPVSESGTPRTRRAKAQRGDSARPQTARDSAGKTEDEHPAAGTLARTKRLLHAALRVWDLKRRIHD